MTSLTFGLGASGVTKYVQFLEGDIMKNFVSADITKLNLKGTTSKSISGTVKFINITGSIDKGIDGEW